MKATIDFDEPLYRHLKVEAARRGRTVRDLVAEGVRYVLGLGHPPGAGDTRGEWAGSLRDYAPNARGKHDLAAMRRSIARARRGSPR
jgi:hypothetical protein